MVRVKLPAGFDFDEVPPPVKSAGLFGTLSASWQQKPGELVITRSLELRPAIVPPEQYKTVRQFFEQVQTTEQATVVLVRAPGAAANR